MGTRRVDFANALLTGIGGQHDADTLRVVIAWMMQEGQKPGENDPLASINEGQPHGEGGSGDRFSFASIDNALAESVKQLSPGHVYSSIGDAFRARKSATELIDAIQAGGWCGGPHAPCPSYGAGVRRNFVSIADQKRYAAEATKLAGNDNLTGAPNYAASNDNLPTASDYLNSIPGVGAAKNAVSAADAVGTLAQHLLDVSFWKRAGVLTIGALLVLFGLAQLGKGMAPNVAGAVKRALPV
jgi:hypothetical protein